MPGADEADYYNIDGVWYHKGELLPEAEVEALGIQDATDFEWELSPEREPLITRKLVGEEWQDVAPQASSVAAQSQRTTGVVQQPSGQAQVSQGGLEALARAGQGAQQPGGLAGLIAAAQAARARPIGSAPIPFSNQGAPTGQQGGPTTTKAARRMRDNYDAIFGAGKFQSAIEANPTLMTAFIKALGQEDVLPKDFPVVVQDPTTGRYFQRQRTGEFKELGPKVQPTRETFKQMAERLFNENRIEEAQRVMDFANQPSQMERFSLGMQLATSPADAFVVNAMRRGDLPIQQFGGRIGPLPSYLTESARQFAPGLIGELSGGGVATPGTGTGLRGETGGATGATPGLAAQLGPGPTGQEPTERTPFQAGQAMNTYGLESVVREQARQRGDQPLRQPAGFEFEQLEQGRPPIEQVFGSQPLEELMNTYGLESVLREQQRLRQGQAPTVDAAPLAPLEQQMQTQGLESVLRQQRGLPVPGQPPEQQALARMLSGEPIERPRDLPSLAQAQGSPLLFRSAQSRGNLTPTEEGIFQGYLGTLGIPPNEFLEEERRATTPGRVFGQTEPGQRIRQRRRRIG